jgi:hypothetical protein
VFAKAVFHNRCGKYWVWIVAMFRTTIGLLFISFFAAPVRSEGLSKFGLSNLKPVSTAKSDRVRGLGMLTTQQGFSLIVGTFLDPDTGSTLSQRSVQYTAARDDWFFSDLEPVGRPSVSARTDREVSVNAGLMVQGSQWQMTGSILTTGWSYVQRF